MSYGPAPWQQQSWDWRAAGNFIGGGAGGGLIAFTALSDASGAALALLLVIGLALIGCGLLCVWMEIGRPLRALHVFFNPRTSWMTREAFTAALLFPAALAAAAGVRWLMLPVAALALTFVYAQARMLQKAKGIPAWREPLVVPLLVATALAEGAGIFIATVPFHRAGSDTLLVVFATLLLARGLAWIAYRRRLGASAVPRALVALDRAGRVLRWVGLVLPLALAALANVVDGVEGINEQAGASAGAASLPAIAAAIMAAGGLLAWIAGSYLKFTLIARGGFNQGFALAHLPVRGVRPATGRR